MTVTDTDDDDDENLGSLIIALMQKNRRKLRKEGLDMLTMGYVIYKARLESSPLMKQFKAILTFPLFCVHVQLKDPDCGPLDLNFFKYNASVAKSPAFINLREVCGRHRLEPGDYCIIPSTFNPNEEGDFLIRIYSEKPSDTQEIDEDTSLSDVKVRGVWCMSVLLLFCMM